MITQSNRMVDDYTLVEAGAGDLFLINLFCKFGKLKRLVMARDKIHHLIVSALKKDGWRIDRDPLYVLYEDDHPPYEIDLGAEKLIGAEKNNQRIAVEVKSFAGSVSNIFHTALGQFITYEAALANNPEEGDRLLFIAIPDEAAEKIFNTRFFMQCIREHGLRFIVVNLESKKIVEWKN